MRVVGYGGWGGGEGLGLEGKGGGRGGGGETDNFLQRIKQTEARHCAGFRQNTGSPLMPCRVHTL